MEGAAPAQRSPLAARAAAWYAALPPRQRERVQDTGLGVGLAVLNLASLLPYLSQLHPLWLALFLVSVQCVPLAVRRDWPVPALILISIPRVAYDQLHFVFAPLPLAVAIGVATVAERSGTFLRWGTIVVYAAALAVPQVRPGEAEPYNAIVQGFIFAAAWAIGTLSRRRRASLAAASERAARAEAELDAVASRAAAAAAAERLRIARELHDVVAHHVSLMAVQAEATGALLPGRPADAARSADLIADTARQAMVELRRLLGVLRAASGSAGQSGSPERANVTPAASLSRVGEVLDQVRGAGLPVELTVSGAPCALSPGVDLTAYRIVQEALTNTMRHAPGSQARVGIAYADSCVTVSITNTATPAGRPPDGPGRLNGHAVLEVAGLGPGFGLAGIAERVTSCGGTLTVGPVPDGGFAVTARLPAS